MKAFQINKCDFINMDHVTRWSLRISPFNPSLTAADIFDITLRVSLGPDYHVIDITDIEKVAEFMNLVSDSNVRGTCSQSSPEQLVRRSLEYQRILKDKEVIK